MTKAIVHLDPEQQANYLEKGKQHQNRLHSSSLARRKRKLRKQHLGIDSSSMPTAEAKNEMPKAPKMPKQVKLGRPSGAPTLHEQKSKSAKIIARGSREKKVQCAALLKTASRTSASIAGEHSFTHAQALLDMESQRNHAQ